MSILNAAKFLMGKVPNTTRVFRGVEPSLNFNKSLSGKMYPKNMTGRFFTESLPDASWYARRGNTLTGKVQYVDLPQKDFNIGRKMSERTPNPRLGGEVILPKKYINKIETDYIQTVAARIKATLNYLLQPQRRFSKGGLAKVLNVW